MTPTSPPRRDDRSRRGPAARSVLAYLFCLVAGCSATGTGCKSAAPAPPPQVQPAQEPGTVDMRLGNQTFHLWVVVTEKTREKGLMFVESMPPDRGMIFVFRDEDERGFWMRNTLIPLDLAYVSADGRVVSIKHGKPHDETPIPSDGAAKYTIELNLGAAAKAGLKAGDRIEIPPSVVSPPGLE